MSPTHHPQKSSTPNTPSSTPSATTKPAASPSSAAKPPLPPLPPTSPPNLHSQLPNEPAFTDAAQLFRTATRHNAYFPRTSLTRYPASLLRAHVTRNHNSKKISPTFIGLFANFVAPCADFPLISRNTP